MINRIAHLAVLFALILLAYLMFNLGMDYINMDIGYGLHPVIAFPIATLSLLAAVAYHCYQGVMDDQLLLIDHIPK